MNPLNPITVQFHQQTLVAIEHDGKPYVAMRQIVENLGLDWKSQSIKINERFDSTVQVITTVAKDGKQRSMLCLPIIVLPGYLYSISPSKVKPELRELVKSYQTECTEVLYNHFTGRAAREHRALLDVLFARHPQWAETRAYVQQGLTQAQIAAQQGKHPRSVGKMIARIRANGIDCRGNHSMSHSIH
jgi:hypothetical protein